MQPKAPQVKQTSSTWFGAVEPDGFLEGPFEIIVLRKRFAHSRIKYDLQLEKPTPASYRK